MRNFAHSEGVEAVSIPINQHGAVGRTRRSGRITGRLVKGDATRRFAWPYTRVVSQRTARPAHEG